MNRIRKLLQTSHGSVIVEFALFLPIILVLMFGIIELGAAWNAKQMLVNASREGARMGSLLNDPSNGNTQVIQMVTGFLQQSGYPGSFSVVSAGADGNPGDQVQVTITSDYQFPVLSSFLSPSIANITLTAATIMRHE
jgi:Flp pilus assembly protein TadG